MNAALEDAEEKKGGGKCVNIWVGGRSRAGQQPAHQGGAGRSSHHLRHPRQNTQGCAWTKAKAKVRRVQRGEGRVQAAGRTRLL